MLPCQRHLFDIPDDVAYLNCAYMSPLMKTALEAGTAGLARKAHPWEITPDKFFTGSDEFRATAAELIDCSADDIAIVPSASYGIATAAQNLPVKKGQSILVLAEQFPSNYYSWQRRAEATGASLKTVPQPRAPCGFCDLRYRSRGYGTGCRGARPHAVARGNPPMNQPPVMPFNETAFA